jgi:hypothetical protein
MTSRDENLSLSVTPATTTRRQSCRGCGGSMECGAARGHPTVPLILFVAALLRGSATVVAFYETCGRDAGGGYCPGRNTCCAPLPRPTNTNKLATNAWVQERFGYDNGVEGSGNGGCIPSDLGSYHGTCCDDSTTIPSVGSRTTTSARRTHAQSFVPLTGCGVGYACGPNITCIAADAVKDPLVARLPRYRLCQQARNEPPKLYGFPVKHPGRSLDDDSNDLKLVYYSTHGDVLGEFCAEGDERIGNCKAKQGSTFIDARKDVDTIFVVIHGALRNADDYFCTGQSAASQLKPGHKTWVISPLFAFWNESASNLQLANGGTALRWGDDVNDPWRSGANAVTTTNASQDSTDDYSLSSYHALDGMLAHLLHLKQRKRLPALKLVVAAGHSSGGQYVQRWSLLSPVWDNRLMRAVVANPSSYAYLTPLRYDSARHEWRIPSSIIDCPDYDQWQWGFEGAADSHNSLSNPYVRHHVRRAGGVDGLIERFRKRQVLYLAGSQDRCNVSGTTADSGWCDSHGLETTWMDLLQGSTRWERYHRYLSSLQRIGLPSEHSIVEGVGHDHSLLFQSPEGLRALFSLDEPPSVGQDSQLVSLAAL